MKIHSDSNMGLPPNKNNHLGRAAQNAGAPPEWLVEAIEGTKLKPGLTTVNYMPNSWSINKDKTSDSEEPFFFSP